MEIHHRARPLYSLNYMFLSLFFHPSNIWNYVIHIVSQPFSTTLCGGRRQGVEDWTKFLCRYIDSVHHLALALCRIHLDEIQAFQFYLPFRGDWRAMALVTVGTPRYTTHEGHTKTTQQASATTGFDSHRDRRSEQQHQAQVIKHNCSVGDVSSCLC